MLVHAHRHLPCTQRPHTRCHSPNTRSLTHSCLTHTHHTTHTRGGTHPRCLTHTGGFAHTCRLPRALGFFPLRCPFHTRRAGKHALRHTRQHTTHTRGFFRTRGFCRIRGRTHNHTHRDTHTGDSRHHKSSRGLHTPQARRAPVRSTRPLNLARHDRTCLVVTRFKGAQRLPLFPREDTQLPAPGLHTLCQLTPIVPR